MGERAQREGEFYVGYLPMPAGYRRFLGRLLPALAGGAALGAGLLAAAQRDPGAAAWERSTVTLRGVLRTEPYPVLEVEGGEVLLVEAGKRGAQRRAAAIGDARTAAATGTRLRRGERQVLELAPGPEGLSPSEAGAAAARAEASLGPVTLRGEIVDAKCHAGAMKPGDGKTHKACATLCLRGGIPAGFVTAGGEWYLLAGREGGPIADDVIAFVGEPVEVRGQARQRGRLLILRVDSVRRL